MNVKTTEVYVIIPVAKCHIDPKTCLEDICKDQYVTGSEMDSTSSCGPLPFNHHLQVLPYRPAEIMQCSLMSIIA